MARKLSQQTKHFNQDEQLRIDHVFLQEVTRNPRTRADPTSLQLFGSRSFATCVFHPIASPFKNSKKKDPHSHTSPCPKKEKSRSEVCLHLPQIFSTQKQFYLASSHENQQNMAPGALFQSIILEMY